MDPEQLAPRIIEAFRAGDLASIQESIAPDVVVHMPGNNVLSGTYAGMGSALAMIARAAAYFDPQGVQLLDVDVHEGQVVCNVEVRPGVVAAGRRPIRLRLRMAFGTDGRIGESWVEPEDTNTWDEFVGFVIDRPEP